MSSIEIRKIGITKLDTDVVVNAANTGLWEGGGVCGYIFHDAGSKEMTVACQKIGHCDEGSAVITSGFKLPAKYVIHAVGPRWSGGEHNESKLLYSAYKQSLLLAKENGLHSIGFPLISAGIFGYPVDKAWRKAIQACNDFIHNNPDYDINIIFAVLDDKILATGEETLKGIVGGEKIEDSVIRWCRKYSVLFHAISEDEELRTFFEKHSAYQPNQGHHGLYAIINACFHEAYDSNVVITDYGQVVEDGKLSDRDLVQPTKEWLDTLTEKQILAVIAWHFRRDHFSEGSWISDSVADGHMAVLVDALLGRCE